MIVSAGLVVVLAISEKLQMGEITGYSRIILLDTI